MLDEHTLDAAALGVDHVQVDHHLRQQGITVDLQRGILLDHRLHIARQERPDIAQDQCVRRLDDIDAAP